jgi:hypothetical protein
VVLRPSKRKYHFNVEGPRDSKRLKKLFGTVVEIHEARWLEWEP